MVRMFDLLAKLNIDMSDNSPAALEFSYRGQFWVALGQLCPGTSLLEAMAFTGSRHFSRSKRLRSSWGCWSDRRVHIREPRHLGYKVQGVPPGHEHLNIGKIKLHSSMTFI
jgi:hypothetical protein